MFPNVSYPFMWACKVTKVLIMGKYYHNVYLRDRRAKFQKLLSDDMKVNVYH